MKIRYRNLALDQAQRQQLLTAVDAVFEHGRLINGPEVQQLESRLVKRINRKHAMAVGSGTASLFIALKALDISSGDEVIVPALSVSANATAVKLCGAIPVFVDTDNKLNLDAKQLEKHITADTKAIMVVHYAGLLADMKNILAIAKNYQLPVIEDFSQALDSFDGETHAGQLGDIACLSLNAMKLLPAVGEAGMLFCDDDDLMKKMHSLSYNGLDDSGACVSVSLNHRMDTIQAAVLLQRLDSLDEVLKKRFDVANRYLNELTDKVSKPELSSGAFSAFYYFNIYSEQRDELAGFLRQRGIEVQTKYPLLLPEQAAFIGCEGSWKIAKESCQQVLSLPISEILSDADVDYVITAVNDFF